MERIPRRQEPGSVEENNLIRFTGENAQNLVAGGLRLGCHDRNLLADQGVHERRLSDVWLADNGCIAGSERGG